MSSGDLLASAVLNETVLPHHVWIVLAPIVPFAGYCKMKKMRITETATPESSAADNTSVEGQSYSQPRIIPA